jgi:NADPH:quinone reductase-like Zn-dependent oxidoreductase
MMQRWELPAFGRDNLVLTSALRPKPDPKEVLVKVEAVSLNYRDLLILEASCCGACITEPRRGIDLAAADGGVAAAGRVANAASGGTGRGGGDTETWLGPPTFSIWNRPCQPTPRNQSHQAIGRDR